MTQQTKGTVVAVVLAAGSGVRFDPAKPKQLVALNGKPIVAWSIEAFENDEHVDDIVVVVNNTVREAVEQLIDDASYAKVRAIITGGAERSDSTEAALTTLADAGIPQDAKILIHDRRAPVRLPSGDRRLHRRTRRVHGGHRGLPLHRHDSAHTRPG